jgi:hypothetical protein
MSNAKRSGENEDIMDTSHALAVVTIPTEAAKTATYQCRDWRDLSALSFLDLTTRGHEPVYTSVTSVQATHSGRRIGIRLTD